MNRNIHRALSLPIALAAALGTGVAFAAAGATAAGGADIRAVCPGIDVELQKSLAPAWSLVEQPGVVQVKMNVQGQKVTAISTSGVERSYNDSVKRAVRQLACSGASEAPQALSFEISFVAPADHGDAPARSGS